MRPVQRLATLLFVLGLVWAPATTAFANDSAQIEQLRAMLDEQDTLDTTGAVKVDRDQARQWLQEAEVLVANGKSKLATQRLRRVEFAVELVTALVAAAQIRQAADAQEAAAYTAPEQLAKLQADVEALRKQKAELQTELNQLRR